MLLYNLRPVLVFVEGDLEAGLSRAIADRGEVWALNLATERAGNSQIEGLIEYFMNLREAANAMLELWFYDVIRVNTIECSIQAATNKILDKVHSSDRNHTVLSTEAA